MNWKNTWILVGLAAALFAFIFFFERRLPDGHAVPPAQLLFADFKPTSATSVTLRRGTDFTISVQLTNDVWRYTRPFAYPAADTTVQQLLEMLERVVPATRITAREILSRKQSDADFGFDAPPVTIVLERGAERRDLRFGARTAAGDQVYVHVGTDPSVFVVSADLLDRVPRTPNDWRTTALFHLGGEKPDRVEVTHNGTSFALQLDPTNKLWKLTRPAHRANQFKARDWIDQILLGRVVEFVTDEARADAEPYGLQTPQFEVTLGAGALARKVQFGRSPTNNPNLVYARLVSHSNVVLVPKSAVEPLAIPYAELRERQILSLAPELVDLVEVRGEESFVVRRDATGAWRAGDVAADPAFVGPWLALLAQLEATEFVRDVVTDFTSYGLSPGLRQYTLRTVVTNAAGVTNIPIAQLAFGSNSTDGSVFVRRMDEDSVYAIRAIDHLHMPAAAWQFRDHRLWNFTTNQVARVTIRQGDVTREAIRQPGGDWIEVKGWPGMNPLAVEQVVQALGELTATMWIARGESAPARFGFGGGAQVTVELKGEKPQSLTFEFGGPSPLRLPYALATVDGQPTVFEFPWMLYADLQRYFQIVAPARK